MKLTHIVPIPVLKFILFFIVLIIGLIIFVRIFEKQMIFYPIKYPAGEWDTTQLGLSVEDCFFTTTDNTKLHGWFTPVNNSNKVLLWFHGNAGNITHRLDNIILFQKYGISTFIIDYRGYGKSRGQPSEQGLYLDAGAAYNFLVQEKGIKAENIIIFGRSLGGGVATQLALERDCAGLILESTMASVAAVARKVFPLLPSTAILQTRFDSIKKIRQIQVPVLIIHGTQDEILPYQQGQRLFEAANEPKFFYPVPGAGHNNLYARGGDAYFQRVLQFVEFQK